MSKQVRRFLIFFLLFVIFGCGGGATSGDPLGTDSVTVEASTTSVSAGQESVITATVVRLNKFPATDRSVSFAFRTNNTGGTLRVVNDKVDGQNKAVAVYTAGSNSPQFDVADTIQVSLSNDAVAVVVITRSGTGIFGISLTLEANPTKLSANQSSIITATVNDNKGNPVSGERVTFSIPVMNSGSPTLTAYSGVSDSNGIVTTIYSPGIASPANQVDDTVQARLADGSSRAVVITRSGSPVIFKIFTLTADPTILSANQSSVITAAIKDNNNNPVSGETVTFSIPVMNSGSPTLTTFSGVSDSNGTVTTIYSPGIASPTKTVDDTVQARLADGSSRAVVITRSGSPVIFKIFTLTANPTTLSANQSSVITAAIKDNNNNPVSGETVAFSIPVMNSGLPALTAYSGVSDSNGIVTTIYSPGIASPGNTVDDTVQARLADGSSRAAVITRSGTGISGTFLTLEATPTTLSANQSSIITATVKDNKGNPVSGETVTFSIPEILKHSGLPTLTPSSGVSDSNGIVTTIYSPGIASPANQVDDTVQARLANGSSRAVVITRKGITPLSITVVASPSSLSADQVSIVTATVTGDNNAGVTVTFSLPVMGSGNPFLSPVTATTDGSGKAVVIYHPGTGSSASDVQDTVQATVGSVLGSVSSTATITRTARTTPPTSVLVLTADPSGFVANASGAGWTGRTVSSILTARVTDSLSRNLSGVTVTFSIISGGGILSSATAVTDGSGKAVVSFTKNVDESAGTTIYVIFKAKLPDAETMITMRIDA